MLYRGISTKVKDEKEGIWRGFTSTSLNINVVKSFAGDKGTIFEIILSEKSPHPNAQTSSVSKYK